jgi:cyclophilin family peptidyl-prolyl cis-trans isomerase
VAQVAASNAPGAYQTPFRGGMATVTNVGNLTFMLFPEYAPHTVNVFQGLTLSHFYNSNTIFHRVITNFVIQGGDPLTNGTGHLAFYYDDEFNPQAMYSGNGQLALANSGKDTGGPQFFVTSGPQRGLDFRYTIFGQLVRGFEVLTNIINTPANTNNRPLADEIIQSASFVPNTADTVLTLTATNRAGASGSITVIADDGVGGRATNVFAARVVADTNSLSQPFMYPNPMSTVVAPVNRGATNSFKALELDGQKLYWFPAPLTQSDSTNISGLSGNYSNNALRTLTYNVVNTNGQLQFFVQPKTNYVGPINVVFDVAYNPSWDQWLAFGVVLPYDEQVCTFIFGDTPISAQTNAVTALAGVPFSNLVLAVFTNGVPGSPSTNFNATINWGDNSLDNGVVTINPNGQKAVLGSHTYAYPGSYPVYVDIESAIGASAEVLCFVTVTNPAAAGTNLLTVQVTGQGAVSPDLNQAALIIGGSYSLTAIPGDQWVLASWSDGNGFVLGTGANLNFTMSPGLRLTANFVPPANPVLQMQSVTAHELVITWLTNYAGFRLEENAALETSNWVNSTNSVSITGTEFQVTVPTTNRARFFRLKHP